MIIKHIGRYLFNFFYIFLKLSIKTNISTWKSMFLKFGLCSVIKFTSLILVEMSPNPKTDHFIFITPL